MTAAPLPPGWETRRLDEVADVRLGRQRSPGNHHGPQLRPYLRAANVGWSGLLLDDVKEMNFSDAEMAVYRLEPNDILLSEASGSADEVGKPALWSGQIADCAFQNTLLRVRTRGPDPKYLLFFFMHLALSRAFARRSRGVGIHHIGRAALASWPVPVPPLDEQRRMVELLEDHLSRLDAASGLLSSAARRWDGLWQSTVEGEITGRGLPTERHARVELADEGVDDGSLPHLPAGWTWQRLGVLADVVGGVTKDAKRQTDPGFAEVPYLRVANVQRGFLDLSTVTTIRVPPLTAEKLRLLPGDVLLNEGGDRDKLGRGWVWNGQIDGCIHQNHVFRARVRDDAIDARLLSWAANSIGGRWCERNGRQSVNLASISLSKIKLMPIPVPPRRDQVAIVLRLQALADAGTTLQNDLRRARARGNALRRSLLGAAFSGQLTPASSLEHVVEDLAHV